VEIYAEKRINIVLNVRISTFFLKKTKERKIKINKIKIVDFKFLTADVCSSLPVGQCIGQLAAASSGVNFIQTGAQYVVSLNVGYNLFIPSTQAILPPKSFLSFVTSLPNVVAINANTSVSDYIINSNGGPLSTLTKLSSSANSGFYINAYVNQLNLSKFKPFYVNPSS
jgi:hypothetical protein